jgi:hypothetical protein
MVLRGLTRAALCLCLAVAGAAPWGLAQAASADTNGDNTVDVLDLQQAVAALLAPGADAALADVNGDGVVDILDVQRILNEASETSAPEAPGEFPPCPPAVPAPSSTANPVFLPVALQQTRLLLEPACPVVRPLPVEERIASPPSTFRLVFGLSPHAPPAHCAEQPYLGML